MLQDLLYSVNIDHEYRVELTGLTRIISGKTINTGKESECPPSFTKYRTTFDQSDPPPIFPTFTALTQPYL